MDQLVKQVRRASRRLLLEQFVSALAWCLCGGLCVAAIGLGVAKLWPIGVDAPVWTWSWLGGGLGAGFLAALLWTWIARRGQLEAAIEIDRRFGLKERVSSTLALTPEDIETEAGHALVADAVRRVERINVGDQFTLSANRRNLLPILPAALAIGLLFLPNAQQEEAEAAVAVRAERKQVQKSSEQLRRKLAQRRKDAEKKNLKEAADLFKKLEEGVRRSASDKKTDRKKAMVKLNDLAKELQKRREKIGDGQQVRRQLNKMMKNLKQGPAEKIAKAMQGGDIPKAMKEIEKLKAQLDAGKLDKKQMEALAKQLGDMQNKLQKALDAHKKAKEDLKREIEKQKKAGNQAQAKKLQQKMDQLERQDKQMQRLRQMAQKMGQCSKCLGEGKASDAAKQLAELGKDLEQLQSQLEEGEMLTDALDQIAEAKDSMKCKKCQGGGCKACQGKGKGQGLGQGLGQGNKPGDGLGGGRGVGFRPEQEDKTGTFDSTVRQNITKGKAVVIGEAAGKNLRERKRGEIRVEFAKPVETRESDPTAGQRLPRSERDHTREYFERLRKGQ